MQREGVNKLNEELLKKLQKIKPEVTNEVTNSGTVLTLSGSVQKTPWYADEDEVFINIETVEKYLSGVEGDITIRLNSGGGDVFEGIEVYNYIKGLENHVTIEITALAASAASLIAMGADEIKMHTGSSMMVHEASTIAWGNKSDIQKTLNALETIDDSIVSIYAERTGADVEEINNWVTEETWFTADEAVEVGLADSKHEKKVDNVINITPETVAEIVANEMKKYTAQIAPIVTPEPKVTGLNKLFKKKGE